MSCSTTTRCAGCRTSTPSSSECPTPVSCTGHSPVTRSGHSPVSRSGHSPVSCNVTESVACDGVGPHFVSHCCRGSALLVTLLLWGQTQSRPTPAAPQPRSPARMVATPRSNDASGRRGQRTLSLPLGRPAPPALPSGVVTCASFTPLKLANLTTRAVCALPLACHPARGGHPRRVQPPRTLRQRQLEAVTGSMRTASPARITATPRSNDASRSARDPPGGSAAASAGRPAASAVNACACSCICVA